MRRVQPDRSFGSPVLLHPWLLRLKAREPDKTLPRSQVGWWCPIFKDHYTPEPISTIRCLRVVRVVAQNRRCIWQTGHA